jgi:ribosomal protein L22
MARDAKDAETKADTPAEQEGEAAVAKEEPETTEAAPASDAAEAAASGEAGDADAAEAAEGAGGAPAGAEAGADRAAAPRSARTAGKRPAGGRVTVQARAKYVRTSARKARLVSEHIKGKTVADARAILDFHPRSVAEDWRKLLDSAVANAEHNHNLVGDDLRVLNATADEGPTLKRFRPRAHGRATRIRKRTSHLTITLTPKEN